MLTQFRKSNFLMHFFFQAVFVIFLLAGSFGHAFGAGVWDAYTPISSGYNPPLSIPGGSGPYVAGSPVRFTMYTIVDSDRRKYLGVSYYDNDTFNNSNAFTWTVKDSSGNPQGTWQNGKNTSNAPFPDVYWLPPSTPMSNLTVYVSVNDDPKPLGGGETGTRDDPVKIWSNGPINTGAAIIWNLTGNVAGNYISGTDIGFNMYIAAMQKSTNMAVGVALGGSDLATGSSHVYVSPVGNGGQPNITTDSNGNWQSVNNPGKVTFDSTHLLADGSSGDLRAKLNPGTAFYSTAISGVTLYNKAYVLANTTDIGNSSTAASSVQSSCSSMNHSVNYSTSDANATILGNLPTYTVFYINTHGGYNVFAQYPNQTVFEECCSNISADYTHYMGSSDVATAVSGKSGVPYYNFVQIDACNSAAYNDMAIAFGILNGDGSTKTDQAYLGWNGVAQDTSDHASWTGLVWSGLQSGNTLSQAVTAANNAYSGFGTPSMLGDTGMTLHKVY